MHSKGPQIESYTHHKIFLVIFYEILEVGVRFPFKNGHFSEAFQSHETPLFLFVSLSYICPIKDKWRRVAEMGQKITFLYVYYAKVQSKMQNFDFFKNGSFKIKNILAEYWYHAWRCAETLRMLPELS